MVKRIDFSFQRSLVRRLVLALFLLVPSTWHLAPAFAQQAQTSLAPIYLVNAKYVQGVGPGYWPTAGGTLTLNLAAGTAYCGNPPVAVAYAGGTLAMADATTNYVFLDPAATCVPASNTTGFAVGHIPIAAVVTAGGAITSITDRRTWFTPPACAVSSAGAINCAALGSNQNITLTPTGIGKVIASKDLEVADGAGMGIGAVGDASLTIIDNAARSAGLRVQYSSTSTADHYGLYFAPELRAPSGTISNVRGLMIFVNDGSGYAHTIANLYSAYIYNPSKAAGSITNNYGLYIAAQTTGSTLNYQLYSAGTAPSYFAGPITAAKLTATTGVFGLNVVTFSSTPTFDANLGNTQKITLTGNVTSSTLSNASAGQSLDFIICQDATGSRTFVWPTNVKGGMTIGSTLSTCSAQNFIFDGTNAYALSAGVTNM